MGDVRLRLAFEKALVPALAETGGRVHDKFGIGRERDAPVAGEIEPMGRLPLFALVIGADLQVNQIIFACHNAAPLPKASPNKPLFRQCKGRPICPRFEKPDAPVD